MRQIKRLSLVAVACHRFDSNALTRGGGGVSSRGCLVALVESAKLAILAVCKHRVPDKKISWIQSQSSSAMRLQIPGGWTVSRALQLSKPLVYFPG